VTPVPARARTDRSRPHGRPAAALRSVSRRETPPVSPRLPRRVSGAAAGSAATTPAGAALPRPVAPRIAPPRFRLRSLPEHRFVDRLLRSRLWIWLLGALLGGIVAMQVSLLKLNSGISRAVETTTTLERQNADLEGTIARLTSPNRIESGAGLLGMVMPAAGDVRYLTTSDEDAARAVRRMRPPSEAAAALLANHGIVPGSLADLASSTQAAGATASTTGASASPTGATASPTGATASTTGTTASTGTTATTGASASTTGTTGTAGTTGTTGTTATTATQATNSLAGGTVAGQG
jgi:hypothetical protein